MKLISMTDFVLSDKVKSTLEYSHAYNMVMNYARFLKRPLELGMFIGGNALFEGLDLEAAKHHISQNRTIEYLANFGKLTLTQNALKHLGL